MVANFVGFKSLVKKEVARFWKVAGQTITSPLINSGLYLLVFGVSLSGVVSPYEGVDYLAFLIPGLVALGAYNNSLQNASSSVMTSKFHGDLQDLRLIPMSSTEIAMAYAVGCWLRGLIVATSIFFISQVFFYFVHGGLLLPKHWVSFFFFLSIGCLIFGNIGIWAGFISNTFDQISAITNFIVLPLIYLGGVFFPLSGLSGFWNAVAHANPLVYLIQGLRWSVLEVSDLPMGLCVGLSLVFLVISGGLAWRAVKFGSYQRF